MIQMSCSCAASTSSSQPGTKFINSKLRIPPFDSICHRPPLSKSSNHKNKCAFHYLLVFKKNKYAMRTAIIKSPFAFCFSLLRFNSPLYSSSSVFTTPHFSTTARNQPILAQGSFVSYPFFIILFLHSILGFQLIILISMWCRYICYSFLTTYAYYYGIMYYLFGYDYLCVHVCLYGHKFILEARCIGITRFYIDVMWCDVRAWIVTMRCLSFGGQL